MLAGMEEVRHISIRRLGPSTKLAVMIWMEGRHLDFNSAVLSRYDNSH
jgi:hypothetical protein